MSSAPDMGRFLFLYIFFILQIYLIGYTMQSVSMLDIKGLWYQIEALFIS